MKSLKLIVFIFLFCFAKYSKAQTDVDGLMMAKKNLCGGLVYGYGSWTNYWEGQNLRINENLGTVSSQSAWVMANYGITDKINFIAMAPYISNKASVGTLIGQQGVQDLSMLIKWEFFGKAFGKNYMSLLVFAGYSTPLTNYVADYLPLSIGMQSNNTMGKIMLDVQRGKWFATASTNMIYRSNVTIDRDAYYTTKMIYSNQVEMPSLMGYHVRLGYRKDADLVLEAVLDGFNTMGGYDIRKNDMPFLSNKMDATRIGFNVKIPIPVLNGLSFTGNTMYTIAGRNMGKSTMFMAGILFQTDFTKTTN